MTQTKTYIKARMTPKCETVLKLLDQSLRFRVELEPHEALALASRLNGYNGWSHHHIVGLVESVNEFMPRMQFSPDNPNNGRPFHKFHFGNECSMVIYVTAGGHHLRRAKAAGSMDFDLGGCVTAAARAAQADEISVTFDDRGNMEARLWWD